MVRRFGSIGRLRFSQERSSADSFTSAPQTGSAMSSSCSGPADLQTDRCSTTTGGPVEYIILAFPGNKFNGEIVPEFAKLTESGTVRLVDLVFITKDANGCVSRSKLDERLKELRPLMELDGEIGQIISHEDVEWVAMGLGPNSSAAFVVWEDTWAASLINALRNSGAQFVEGGRVSAL